MRRLLALIGASSNALSMRNRGELLNLCLVLQLLLVWEGWHVDEGIDGYFHKTRVSVHESCSPSASHTNNEIGHITSSATLGLVHMWFTVFILVLTNGLTRCQNEKPVRSVEIQHLPNVDCISKRHGVLDGVFSTGVGGLNHGTCLAKAKITSSRTWQLSLLEFPFLHTIASIDIWVLFHHRSAYLALLYLARR